MFVLSNAAITFNGSTLDPLTAAVALGLLIRKPLGITLAVFTAVRSQREALPRGVTWSMVHRRAWLGGIGFTSRCSSRRSLRGQ